MSDDDRQAQQRAQEAQLGRVVGVVGCHLAVHFVRREVDHHSVLAALEHVLEVYGEDQVPLLEALQFLREARLRSTNSAGLAF